jgi:Tol biopolymer transport system component/predicted Ser/Thr protein kinase
MALTRGERLGPYEILGLLGAGGMGEVYKARDSRLGRLVAIKTSKQQFSERFTREARAVAALNHPNVCTLYDVGPDYLVMELVDGQPPAGPMPLEDALHIARQLCSALEAAHERGIVHRDLKPANILVKPDGAAKILDFGIATEVLDPASASANEARGGSVSTAVGAPIGTPEYMSPEQVHGRSVDKRADIWAFGVVLYELITGVRAFSGGSRQETLAAVLTKEPDLARVPPEVCALLALCLEKDPRRRLRDIGDAMAILEAARVAQPWHARRGLLSPWMYWAGAAFLVAAAGFVGSRYFARAPAALEGSWHYAVDPPAGTTFPSSDSPDFALSADGRLLAFVAGDAAGPLLWVRRLDGLAAQRLDGTEGASLPFWSPDASALGFFADAKLKRIPVSGGEARILCDAPAGGGGTWSARGIIIFAPNRLEGALQSVPANGGPCRPASALDDEIVHRFPHFLPDGRRFLYLALSLSPERTGVYAQALDSDERTFIGQASTKPAIVPSGLLLHAVDGTLLARGFDVETLAFTGDPVAVADIAQGTTGDAAYSVSDNGVLAFRASAPSLNRYQPVWYTRDGQTTDAALGSGFYYQPALSPDGARLALTRQDPAARISNVWLLELATGAFSPLTFGATFTGSSVWAPDSERLAFASAAPEGVEIHTLTVGASDESVVLADGRANWVDDWTPDGKWLVYHEGDRVALLPAPGAEESAPPTVGSPRDLVQQTLQVRVSPDGRWVAYTSMTTGLPQIFVAAFPSFTEQQQVSVQGGVTPQWGRDGRELFYLTTDRELMAVDIRIGARLEASEPRRLFPTKANPRPAIPTYAVAADGARFLVLDRVAPADGSDAPGVLDVIINWPRLVQ